MEMRNLALPWLFWNRVSIWGKSNVSRIWSLCNMDRASFTFNVSHLKSIVYPTEIWTRSDLVFLLRLYLYFMLTLKRAIYEEIPPQDTKTEMWRMNCTNKESVTNVNNSFLGCLKNLGKEYIINICIRLIFTTEGVLAVRVWCLKRWFRVKCQLSSPFFLLKKITTELHVWYNPSPT